MIYCVWYPSGGFGHYVNAVLNLHGDNFKRTNSVLNFDSEGRSHQYQTTAPKYMHSQGHYNYKFDPSINDVVLIDNGIGNPDVKWKDFFPDTTIIKICYNDQSWPLIMQTYAIKAMRKSIAEHYKLPDTNDIDTLRTSYLDVLLNNRIRYYYKPDPGCLNLEISDLFEYNKFKSKLESFGIVLSEFKTLWDRWYAANAVYLMPLETAKQVVDDVKNRNLQDLSIQDPLTQAITLFYLRLENPNITMPDTFFTNTQQIIDWSDGQ
jgi:hypothetical protein